MCHTELKTEKESTLNNSIQKHSRGLAKFSQIERMQKFENTNRKASRMHSYQTKGMQ